MPFTAIEAIQKANIEEIQKDFTSSDPSDYVPDELLVQLRLGVSENRAQQIYRGQGAAVFDRLPQIRTHLVRVPAAALEKVQVALARRPEFHFVEKNRIHAPVVSPDDPYYLKQWHLPAISAPSAWDLVGVCKREYCPGATGEIRSAAEMGCECVYQGRQCIISTEGWRFDGKILFLITCNPSDR